MTDYENISLIEKLDDGTMNVLMKDGIRAYIEIRRLEAAFKASIYRLREGESPGGGKLIKEVTHNSGLQECARTAIGWLNENPVAVSGPKEIKKDVRMK